MEMDDARWGQIYVRGSDALLCCDDLRVVYGPVAGAQKLGSARSGVNRLVPTGTWRDTRGER